MRTAQDVVTREFSHRFRSIILHHRWPILSPTYQPACQNPVYQCTNLAQELIQCEFRVVLGRPGIFVREIYQVFSSHPFGVEYVDDWTEVRVRELRNSESQVAVRRVKLRRGVWRRVVYAYYCVTLSAPFRYSPS